MLNVYAEQAHRQIGEPESRTIIRARNVWQQSQERLERSVDPETRVADHSESTISDTDDSTFSDSSPSVTSRTFARDERPIAATNAYLHYLDRLRKYEEMLDVFHQIPSEGVARPDWTTYFNVYGALRGLGRTTQSRNHRETLSTGSTAGSADSADKLSPTQSPVIDVWNRMLLDMPESSTDHRSRLDDRLISRAVDALLLGIQPNAKIAIAICRDLFGLPVPLKLDSGLDAQAIQDISILPPDSKRSEIHLSMAVAARLVSSYGDAKLPRCAASYASALMPLSQNAAKTDAVRELMSAPPHAVRVQRPDSENRGYEFMFYGYACRAFSDIGDVKSIMRILEEVSPPSAGWSSHVWRNGLTAARFAKDWTASKEIWTRMLQQPTYRASRKHKQDPPLLVNPVDATTMSTMLSTALRQDLDEAYEAWNMFLPFRQLLNEDNAMSGSQDESSNELSTPSKAQHWRRSLGKRVQTLVQKLQNSKYGKIIDEGLLAGVKAEADAIALPESD